MVRAGKQRAEKLPLKKQPGERHHVRHRQGRPVDLRPPPVLQLLHGEEQQGGGEDDGGARFGGGG